jgi:hypothetical protein
MSYTKCSVPRGPTLRRKGVGCVPTAIERCRMGGRRYLASQIPNQHLSCLKSIVFSLYYSSQYCPSLYYYPSLCSHSPLYCISLPGRPSPPWYSTPTQKFDPEVQTKTFLTHVFSAHAIFYPQSGQLFHLTPKLSGQQNQNSWSQLHYA